MPAGSRFYDVETGEAMRLQLEQCGTSFRLLRPFGYRSDEYPEAFIVPADLETFETDLASIPWFFAWLVPGLGTHLPAVLLHDGLVLKEGEPKAHIGPDVDREEADRILRDAMATLGVGKVRRWIMWAAVTLATAWKALRPAAWWRGLVLGTVGTITVLGAVATLDLLDVWDGLPWMGPRAWWVEVAGGAAVAVAVPLVLSALWGRLWAAGAITGVALAFLLHVTAAIAVLYGLYSVVEAVLSRSEGSGPNARKGFEAAVAVAAARRIDARTGVLKASTDTSHRQS